MGASCSRRCYTREDDGEPARQAHGVEIVAKGGRTPKVAPEVAPSPVPPGAELLRQNEDVLASSPGVPQPVSARKGTVTSSRTAHFTVEQAVIARRTSRHSDIQSMSGRSRSRHISDSGTNTSRHGVSHVSSNCLIAPSHPSNPNASTELRGPHRPPGISRLARQSCNPDGVRKNAMLSSAYDTDAMLPVSSPSGRVNLDTEQAPPGALRVPVLDAAVHLHRHSGPGAQKQAIVRDRYVPLRPTAPGTTTEDSSVVCLDLETGDLTIMQTTPQVASPSPAPSAPHPYPLLSDPTIARSLRHPNVLSIHDTWPHADPGGRFVAMTELPEGGTVQDETMEGPVPLSEDACRSYATQLVAGLGFLHGCGIVHGNLRPANILLSADATLKIGGFGAARVYGGSDVLESSPSDAPAVEFRAPECATGLPYSGRAADIWSLGATLFHFLFGRPPHGDGCGGALATSEPAGSGPLEFPDGFPVSDSCKDLLSAVLCKDPARRMELDEIAMHPWILSAPSRSRWGLPRNSLSAAPLRMKDISAIDREGGAVGASRDAETAKASRMSAWLSEGPEGSRVAPSVASRAFLEGPQAAAEAPDRNAWPAGLEGLAASRGTPVASVGGLKRAEGPGGSQCLAGMEDRLAEVGDGADRHAGGEATEHLGSWELVDSQVRMWGWGGWQRGAAGDAGGAAGGGAEEEERGGEKQAVEVDDGPDMAQAVKDLLFWLQPRGQAWLQDFADGAFVMVEGQPSNFAAIVEHGRVEILKQASRPSSPSNRLFPGFPAPAAATHAGASAGAPGGSVLDAVHKTGRSEEGTDGGGGEEGEARGQGQFGEAGRSVDDGVPPEDPGSENEGALADPQASPARGTSTCAWAPLAQEEQHASWLVSMVSCEATEVNKIAEVSDSSVTQTRLAVRGPGTLLGEMGLLSRDGARVCSVRAVGRVRVWMVPRDLFLEGLRCVPGFDLALKTVVAKRRALHRLVEAMRALERMGGAEWGKASTSAGSHAEPGAGDTA